jgi:uncharacterized membrane protein
MTSAITLIGATLTMGLAAGVFALFAHTIMPGLHSADDRTFVDAFQHLDRAIVNPWFMVTAFLGRSCAPPPPRSLTAVPRR